MVIDSPGYGYTYVPVKVKRQWQKMMSMYLSHAVRLSLVVMLVDAKHGLKACDIEMLNKLAYYQKPVQLVFSKVDKLRPGTINQNLEKAARTLSVYPNAYPEIYLVSAEKMFGV